MENSLHYRLRASHTYCQQAILRDLRQKGDLKPGEPKILEFLQEHEPCEQKEIARGCNLDAASVTGILKRMEERNLIRREMKNGNRRSLYVSMTELGKERVKEVEETFHYVDAQALAGFSEQETADFFRMLDRVYVNLRREDLN